MARVRLLRQSLEDYNRKVNAANAEAGARNEAYQRAYAPYSTAVEQYNLGVDAVQQYTDGPVAGVKHLAMDGGLYEPSMYGGFTKVEDLGSEITREEGIARGDLAARPTTEDRMTDSDGNQLEPGTPEYDAKLAESQAQWDAAATAQQQGYLKYYLGPGGIARAAYSEPTAPADPVPVEAPRAPNLTQSDIRELRAPSLDQAGMQMAANRGIIGKSELSGMDMSKNSAFADPNDPNNLKEAGILARTLGGQL